MARLIYSMLTSLDGYTEDGHGRFGWGAPEDEEVHSYINALASSLGTYLYGRRMYETMVYWETAHRSRPTAVRTRLGAAVAGGREDRLLTDPSRAAQRTNAH
jgi:dihydrofolate reductase